MKELEAIAKDCELFGEPESAVEKITSLEQKYSSEDLVKIYNYFLSRVNDSQLNPDVIMCIIRSSDKIRDKSTLNPLLDILLLKTPDFYDQECYVNVRSMAAKAIANLKDTTAVTPLLYCLNNKNEHYRIRLACADALGRIGDKYAVAPLIDVVKDEGEKSVYLRESAVSALGMLGDLRAVEPLVEILEAQKGLWSKFTFLKERVIEALGKLRLDDDRVFKALKGSLDDESPQIRINTIEAIMESEHPHATEVIRTCLKDSDDEVKKNALIALYNLEGRDILDEVLTDPSYSEFLHQESAALITEYEDDLGDNYDE